MTGALRRGAAAARLALLVASGANFLVLDEPTNHLDVESREALEAALEAFPGTILLVSHDRALLDAVPDRIVAFEDGLLRSYDWRLGRPGARGGSDVGSRRAGTERKRACQACAAPAGRRTPSELELLEATDRRCRGADRRARGESSRRTGRTWTSSARTAPRGTSSWRCLERWEVVFGEAHAT